MFIDAPQALELCLVCVCTCACVREAVRYVPPGVVSTKRALCKPVYSAYESAWCRAVPHEILLLK